MFAPIQWSDKQMLKKVFCLFVVFSLAACSNLSFNQRYDSVGWNKVIIAPFSGDKTKVAEQEFEHLLSTSNKLSIVPASFVKQELIDRQLQDLYKSNPMMALQKLATDMQANGILLVEIQTEDKGMKYDIAMREASIFAKLINTSNREIVASSQFQVSSVMDSTNELVKSVSHDAIEEMEVFFDKLNGIEPKLSLF